MRFVTYEALSSGLLSLQKSRNLVRREPLITISLNRSIGSCSPEDIRICLFLRSGNTRSTSRITVRKTIAAASIFSE